MAELTQQNNQIYTNKILFINYNNPIINIFLQLYIKLHKIITENKYNKSDHHSL